MSHLPPVPGLPRRLASLIYETLLAFALLLVASFPVVSLLPHLPPPWSRLAYQAYLLLVLGAYFVWCWRRGQTLAMKTWRIRLVSVAGTAPTRAQAWLRYALAVLGLLAGGIGLLWALWDRDGQFLHDRLAGTRLVGDDPPSRATAASAALDAPEGDQRPETEQGQGR
ncbi:MAG: RDD family protein [Thiobacillaceae bacterium]|nr:RDD family protein [Thiobacillaceae bacterium]